MNTNPRQVRLGLQIHATAFVVGMLVMLIVNVMIGSPYWVLWVLPGWTIGILAHWLGVRRHLNAAMAIAVVALSMHPSTTHAQQRSRAMNIVLVHGAWADGSGWQKVSDILQKRGYRVTIVQNPLTSLTDDVAAVDRVLARQDGPALLVGHSYGGAVITEAGDAENVAGLVYVAAFAPDAGESVAKLTEGGSPPPLQPSKDGFLFFDPAIFPQAFAQDLPAEQGAFLAASQVPPAGVAFGTPISTPAWKTRKSWYALSTEDRVIPPAAQEQMAKRANATITRVKGSHMAYMSQPEAVADVIDQAARAVLPGR